MNFVMVFIFGLFIRQSDGIFQSFRCEKNACMCVWVTLTECLCLLSMNGMVLSEAYWSRVFVILISFHNDFLLRVKMNWHCLSNAFECNLIESPVHCITSHLLPTHIHNPITSTQLTLFLCCLIRLPMENERMLPIEICIFNTQSVCCFCFTCGQRRFGSFHQWARHWTPNVLRRQFHVAFQYFFCFVSDLLLFFPILYLSFVCLAVFGYTVSSPYLVVLHVPVHCVCILGAMCRSQFVSE